MTRRYVLAAVLILLLVAATRWPLAPKYLYYFDSVNFALALDDFNPAAHQPQPPGYPLFVGFARILHLFVGRAEDVFILAGVLAASAAVILVWALGDAMFERGAGLLAAALLFANPAFWLAGVSNQVRLFLALGSTAVALPAWRALSPGASPAWWYGAFAALGIAAGFRPAEAMLMFPLLLWVWARTGRSIRRLPIAGIVLAACVAPWLIATAAAVGGLTNWFDLLWGYAKEQFRGSSAPFGAAGGRAWEMAKMAVVWTGLGTLTWLWAAPFVKPERRSAQAAFLAVWAVPAFLFSAIIHIGDPDQALTTIPALCVVGGAVLNGFFQKRWPNRLAPAAALVVGLNAVLFFVPPGRLARASSYRAVKAVDGITRSTFDAIRHLRDNGPLVIVHCGSAVAWRQLAYYFPEDYVVVLPSAYGPGEAWTIFRGRIQETHGRSGDIHLPGQLRVVCLPAHWQPHAFKAAAGWRQYGPASYRDPEANQRISLGAFELIAGPEKL